MGTTLQGRARWFLWILPVIWTVRWITNLAIVNFRLLIVAFGAAWNRSLYCTKSCVRSHACKKALILWKDGLHYRCEPCRVEMTMKRPDCDHRFTGVCHELGESSARDIGVAKMKEMIEKLGVNECAEVVDVAKDCGHAIKGIPCFRTSEVKRERCMETVTVKLPCHHEKEMDCFENYESLIKKIRCVEKVSIMLPCHHEKEMNCEESRGFDAETFRCEVEVTEILSCKHRRVRKCSDVSIKQDFMLVDIAECEEIVKVKFPCDHETHVKCGTESLAKCTWVIVLERDRCKHPTEIKCGGEAIDLEAVVCGEACGEIMPCGHECEKPCRHLEGHKCERICGRVCGKGHKCDSTHSCGTRCPPCNYNVTERWHECGHDMSLPCEEDEAGTRARILGEGCSAKCVKPMFCGHRCKAPCHQHRYGLVKGTTLIRKLFCPPCTEDKHDSFLPCGHQCIFPCREHKSTSGNLDCPPCVVAVATRTCKLGHTKSFTCDEIAKHRFCLEERVLFQSLQCGHVNEVIVSCGRLYFDPGEKPAKLEEQDMKVDVILDSVCGRKCGARRVGCGHVCESFCRDCFKDWMHPRCAGKCPKRLMCGHKCSVPCDIMCEPCDLPCPKGCAHGPCDKPCADPCTPCELPCLRECIHGKCSKLCHEICDVKPCVKECPITLTCGHPCIGFCGEECPTLCSICHVREIYEMNRQWIPEEDVAKNRFVLLPDCGHVILATALDSMMQSTASDVLTESWNIVGLKTCPYRECRAVIWNQARYFPELQRVAKLYEKKKEEGRNLSLDVVFEITEFLRTKFEYRHKYPGKFNDFKDYIESLLFKSDRRIVQLELLRATPQMIPSIEILARVYAVFMYMVAFLEDEATVKKTTDKFVSLGIDFVATLKTFKIPFHPQQIWDIREEMKKIIDRFLFCHIYTQANDNMLVTWLKTEEKEVGIEKDILEAETIVFQSRKYGNSQEETVLKGLKLLGLHADKQCSFSKRLLARNMMGIMDGDSENCTALSEQEVKDRRLWK